MLWSDFSHSAFKPSREAVREHCMNAWVKNSQTVTLVLHSDRKSKTGEHFPRCGPRLICMKQTRHTSRTHKLLISQASISLKSERLSRTHNHTYQNVEIDFNYIWRSVPGLLKIWFKLCILSSWGRSSDCFQGPTSCLPSSEWWDKSHKSSLWEWPLAGWAGWFLM